MSYWATSSCACEILFILFFRQGSFSKASSFKSSFRIVSSKKSLRLKELWQGGSRGEREIRESLWEHISQEKWIIHVTSCHIISPTAQVHHVSFNANLAVANIQEWISQLFFRAFPRSVPRDSRVFCCVWSVACVSAKSCGMWKYLVLVYCILRDREHISSTLR